MRILNMNDDDKFDIDLSQIEAKIDDNNLFDKSEKPTVDAINKFISTKHEFKNQKASLITGNFFVEYRMRVKGRYHDSGIITTKADLQTYTVNEMIFSFPTEFIYWVYINKESLEIQDAKKNDTDYIATGILIPIYRIFDLYKDYHQQKRIKQLFDKKK